MKLDALGKPINVGKLYGYSTTDGGWTEVVVGRAAKETAQRVTLENIKRNSFLYGEPTERSWKDSKTVSVKSCLLFPVAEEENAVQ